tara:strand:+ start:168 stop:1106 length:939 start_codon:yes stop_codon:yes gene_type:complete
MSTEVETQLFGIFNDFIRDLSKTFPEIKSCLYRNYEGCLTDVDDKKLCDLPKLNRFLELIGDYEKMITDKNLEFFDLEVEFLEEISFKLLWTKNISNKTRESIWKYLQTFQLININLRSSQQLKDALSQIGTDTEMEVDRSTAKDLKKMKKLSDSVKEEVKGESELDDMLGGLMDGGIGDIAKEVAKSMDIENMFGNIDGNSNPMEIMAQMMNPEKMGSIFNNINSVMEQKMESGELTKDSLKSEAEGMMGKMGDNPMFKNMMQGMDPAMQQGMNATGSAVSESTGSESSELTREEKQKRLREKINEKKNNR